MKTRKDKLAAIARAFDLEIMYAFGSHAEDALKWLEDEQISSLDFVSVRSGYWRESLRQKETLSVKEKVQLSMALEDLFSVNRVDLVSLPEADPFLAANIIRGERIFSKDTYLADEYDLYVLRRAGDLIPLERERIGLIMGKEK